MSSKTETVDPMENVMPVFEGTLWGSGSGNVYRLDAVTDKGFVNLTRVAIVNPNGSVRIPVGGDSERTSWSMTVWEYHVRTLALMNPLPLGIWHLFAIE